MQWNLKTARVFGHQETLSSAKKEKYQPPAQLKIRKMDHTALEMDFLAF